MCVFLRKLFGGSSPTVERPSPKIRITPGQANQIIKAIQKLPGFGDCFICAIAPTNSMEPSIDDGMYVILQPVPYTDLIVGDVIWYETLTFKAIHRIIEKTDTYCRCRGDNNGADDPVQIYAEHIKGALRMIIN